MKRFRSTSDSLSCKSQTTTRQKTSMRLEASILSCRCRQPLVDELLHAVALRLTGHDIPLRVDVETVQMKELAGLAPGSADVADLFERCAIENRDAFV